MFIFKLTPLLLLIVTRAAVPTVSTRVAAAAAGDASVLIGCTSGIWWGKAWH